MADPPKWPAFPIGPRDSIFAMGVVSLQFNALEVTLRAIFGTVFRLMPDEQTMICTKIGSRAVVTLIEQKLPKTGWCESHQDGVAHFIKAFSICVENRDHLAHSELAWAEETVLIKRTRQGQTVIAAPTLDELRAVADDMHVYCGYGFALVNAINLSFVDPPPFPSSFFPWPDKPALPRRMDYKSALPQGQ